MNKKNIITSLIMLSSLTFFSGCFKDEISIPKANIVNKNVDSLNIKIIELAKLSRDNAKKIEADYFAPITFALGDKYLKKSINIIETDYSKSDLINTNADLAQKNYDKAVRIAQLSKFFGKKDFVNEDYIIWYWKQLENINSSTKMPIDFTKENNLMIKDLKTNISTLSSSLEESQKDYASLAQKYAALKDKQKLVRKPVTIKQESKLDLYEFAKTTLNEKDVKTTQEKNGISLFVTGLDFEKKKAEFSNQTLIEQIVQVINFEKNLNIKIVAHTDSIGTLMQNQQLSEERVKNVLIALAKSGGLDTSKIKTKAYGESQPVKSNMLKPGRYQNRRIEIYLTK